MAIIKKPQTINVGEDVEIRDPLALLVGMLTDKATKEVPYKTKNGATIWPSNPTTEHIPWENHDSKRHMCSLNVHYSSIYNSQDMSTDRWMDKDVVHNEMFKWVIYALQCKLFKMSPRCFQINDLFIILFSFPFSRFWVSFQIHIIMLYIQIHTVMLCTVFLSCVLCQHPVLGMDFISALTCRISINTHQGHAGLC